MRCIITGGAGYIGKHLALDLLEKGHTVTILDKCVRKAEKLQRPSLSLWECDLLNAEHIENILRHVLLTDKEVTVFHLAGLADARNTCLADHLAANYSTTKNVVDVCSKYQKQVQQILFASSSIVYYDNVSPYSRSKQAAEKYLEGTYRQHNIPTTIFRLYNVTGEHPSHTVWEDHENEGHLIPRILRLKDEFPEIPFSMRLYKEEGAYVSPTRSYIDVMDVVAAFTYKMNTSRSQIQQLDVRTDVFHTNIEVLQICEQVMGKKVPTILFVQPIEASELNKDVTSAYGPAPSPFSIKLPKPYVSLEASITHQYNGEILRNSKFT